MSSMAAPSTAPAMTQSATPEPRTWEWIESFLESKLTAIAGEDRHLWVAIPAPQAPIEQLLTLTDMSYGTVWDPPSGVSFAGVGAAWKIDLRGPERFRQLRERADRILNAIRVERHGDSLDFEPRALGGFAFGPGAADEPPWQELGDGCFTLPRFVYAREGDSAALALTVHGSEAAHSERRAFWLKETRRILVGLEHPMLTSERTGLEMAKIRRDESVRDPDWIRRIVEIREAIHRGEFEKIVAARRSEVELPADLRAPELLGLLHRTRAFSTRFAFCRPKASFLGVTPERLLAKSGDWIHTEALAGSIERGHAAELLDSGKDRLEQQLVVDSIVRRLESVCDDLRVGAKPTIRELRNVLHLHTPISGRLNRPRHILELVEMLHPTPAVGGVPTPEAVTWIMERETHARGWYSAPIGWFDARGDGELAVALRSCVLTEGKAYLFVGAGIVGDSDPELELQETELKEEALLSALRA